MVEYWFDTRTGDHIVGEAAITQRLEESGPGDVLPLADIVLADTFPYGSQDYESFESQGLTRDDFLNYGRWIVRLLSADERFSVLRGEHLKMLSRLGVAPGRSAIMHHLHMEFGEYRTAIEAPVPEKKDYGSWTRRRHVERMQRLETRFGRKPTARELAMVSREGDGPPNWAMGPETGGTPADINECLGYPNIRAWDTEEHFVRRGAYVMDVNDGRPLTQTLIKLLTSRGRGPSPKTITENCGSYLRFAELATERYLTDPTSYEARLSDANKRLVDLGDRRLVNSWVKNHIDDPVVFVAKYDILQDSVADLDELERQYWALEANDSFVQKIIAAVPNFEAEDVYLSAIATKHTDDIWRLSDRWRDTLLVSDTDVPYVHLGNRARYATPVTREAG